MSADVMKLRYFKSLVLDRRDVKTIKITALVQDTLATVRMTDLQVQEGSRPTGYVQATSQHFRRDDDGPRHQHFNGVLRKGKRTVIVANRTADDSYEKITERVTGGLDISIEATRTIPSGEFRVGYMGEIRTYTAPVGIPKGSTLKHLATTRETTLDGSPVNAWGGPWKMAPADFSHHSVDVGDSGSGVLLMDVDMWFKDRRL